MTSRLSDYKSSNLDRLKTKVDNQYGGDTIWLVIRSGKPARKFSKLDIRFIDPFNGDLAGYIGKKKFNL